ncbi:MAG: acyl-[acyl-carrier-protein] thioesterase [Paludibacteraceae bacterium]|nr:acyl-[acyl-carrier-protein] thioesterase [Paludibacteraceae bacterium]
MENIKLIGDYSFKVQPSEVDFRQKMTLPNFMKYIIATADDHAATLGLALGNVATKNKSWVISRLAIELKRYPITDEKVRVHTWVKKVMRAFSLREFAFMSEDGSEVWGYASSIWAMIDKDDRHTVNLTNIVSPDIICDEPCPIERVGKIPNIDVEPTESFVIKYSDVDLNHHLNSCKYIEHIVDVFSLYKFCKRDIKRFEIEYIAESLFGTKIDILKKGDGEEGNKYIIELKNEKGDTICKSKVIFGDQTLHEEYIIK